MFNKVENAEQEKILVKQQIGLIKKIELVAPKSITSNFKRGITIILNQSI
jgi:hypothetical protein